MNNQRRNSSSSNMEVRNTYKEKLSVEIGGQKITESDAVKTLGVIFDSQLSFGNYWSDMKTSGNQRTFISC